MDTSTVTDRPGLSTAVWMHIAGIFFAQLVVCMTTWWLLPFWYAVLVGWLLGGVLYLGGLWVITSSHEGDEDQRRGRE